MNVIILIDLSLVWCAVVQHAANIVIKNEVRQLFSNYLCIYQLYHKKI